MQLNFQLFDNFKAAAEQCNLDVIPGKGYYTIRLHNGRYIFCWTPLNKIWGIHKYYEKGEWDRALNDLKDNFADFHLEFGGDTLEDMNAVCDCFWQQTYNRDITVSELVEIIEIMSDEDKFQKKLMWVRLQQDYEEAA